VFGRSTLVDCFPAPGRKTSANCPSTLQELALIVMGSSCLTSVRRRSVPARFASTEEPCLFFSAPPHGPRLRRPGTCPKSSDFEEGLGRAAAVAWIRAFDAAMAPRGPWDGPWP